MKKLILAFVVLCTCHHLAAQAPAPHRFTLHSINALGLQNGSSGSNLAIQSILGVSFKHSFAGVGAGIDLYKFRSVPLFVDLRQELGRKKRNFFLYGDVGYNLPWLTEPQKEQQQINGDGFKSSLYWDAGLGYQARFDKDALLFSLGYSYKELKNLSSGFICTGSCSVIPQTIRYHMPRVVLKAGWRF